MSGPVFLLGGAEFGPAHADLDAEMLRLAETDVVTVVPTAAAYEEPERLRVRAEDHFEELGARVDWVPVLGRGDAVLPANAERVRAGKLIYLVDGSTMHVESVLKRSAVWDAIVGANTTGSIVAASGASGRVVCDPMVDPRGGAFAVGLGLVRDVAFVPMAEAWSDDREQRTRKLLPSGVELHVVPSNEHVRIR